MHIIRRRAQGTRIRALVVDDDDVARTLLVKLLRHLGHDAIPAGTAEDALAKFEQTDPDLVLLDVVLPGMDGVTALQLMKKARPQRWLPVILISAKDTSSEILHGLHAGADDYLTKPISIRQVAAKLKNLTESLALHNQLCGSLRFAQAVMDHMQDALLCIDQAGRVLLTNPAAERMFGAPTAELVGSEFAHLVLDTSPDSISRVATVAGRTFGTAVRRGGSHFQFEAQTSSIELDGRSVTVMTLRDIDRQMDEERRALNDAARLRAYHAERDTENRLGREMLDRLLYRNEAVIPNVHYSTVAATGFSGDVVTALRSPTGKLFVMMADATGHGLAAAISLVPALSVLHAMVRRDCTLSEVVREMNDKLCELTPVDRFVSATIIRLDENERIGELWVGGMPAGLLVDDAGQARRFESQHLPLGITPSNDELSTIEKFAWTAPTQLLLISDGVLEAESPLGEQFGEVRVMQALRRSACDDHLASVSSALNAHLAGFSARDDASIAVINLD
jgi:PAS domain S-box-containing protein